MKTLLASLFVRFTSAVTLGMVVCCAVATNVSAQTNCATPPSGLVGWWKGENNALDSAGTNNGTLAGNATYSAGRVGQAFVFDGGGDAVQLANSTNLQLQNFTIEAWIRRSSVSIASQDLGGGELFSFGSGGYGLLVDNDGTAYLVKNNASSIASSFQITDTNWHHLAVTKSGTTVVFYLEGVAYPAASYAATFTFATPPAIGARGDNLANSFLGMVDEVSVYNRALGTNEVQSIYNAGSSGKCLNPPPPCATPPSGLVGWWKGEGNALDSVGSNNGTLAGNTTYGSGRVGQGFVFDGNNDGVQLANQTNLQLQNFSIEAWIKRSDASIASQDIGGGELFSFGSGGYGLLVDNDGTAYLVKNNASSVPSSFQITDTNWHHLAVTKSGTNVVFYLEGVAYPAAPYVVTFTFTTPAAVGARGDNLANSFLGVVDEVSVYNRPLTAGEIQSIYNAGSAGKCAPPPPCVTPPSGLVSWWRGEGNALDHIGGNNGEFVNNVTFTNGRVGQGFLFDGVNSYMRVPHHPSLNFSNAVTVEFWYNDLGSSGSYYDLVAKTDLGGFNNGPINFTVQVEHAGSRGVQLSFNDPTVGGGHEFSAYLPVPTAGAFHHLAATFRQSDATHVEMRTFIDGQLVKTLAVVANFSNAVNALPVTIGGKSTGDFLRGVIDEVSLYNRALSEAEIQSIYNASSSGKCVPPPCVTPPSGLVSWWKAENNALDSVGTNNGTLTGGITFTNGKVGQTFNLDGVDDHVVVADAPSLNFGPGQDFSIEAWIQPQVSSTSFDVMTIVDKRNAPNTSQGIGYEVAVIGGRLECRISDSIDDPGTSFGAAGPDLRDGLFHHVAVTIVRNSTTGGHYYVDGVEVLTFNPTVEPGNLSNDQPLRIGKHPTPSVSAFFKGKIDEVSIYNRALSTNDVQAIYNAGSAGKCAPPPPPPCVTPPSGLVSWWRGQNNAMDQISGNNGTNVGNAAFGPGRVGQGFVFDGNGDGVDIGNPANLQLQNFTIETWIKRASPSRATQGPQLNGTMFSGPNGGYGLGLWDDGRLLLSKIGVSGVFSTTVITDTNTFHHVAVTKSGANVFFYVDGVAESVGPYDPGFVFNGPMAIGARGGDYGTSFFGSIDEVSVYNRALSTNEIQSIYNAGSAGKCVVVVPPLITTQPQNKTVVVGESATFNVTATGTQPLSYQWRMGGTNIAGATASSLVLTNVQFANAGTYSVVVSNVADTATSSNAVLTVNPPPPCATPPSGLVGWWKGENNALDSSGTNNGTLAGNTTFGAARVGQGFVFDGNGDGVNVGNPPNLQLQNFTIETWIKRANASRATQGASLNGTMFAGPGEGYAFGLWDDGRIFLSKVGISAVFSTLTITDINTFHHVAVTKSGNNVVLYVDGVAESVGPYDPGFAFNGPMAVGARGGDYAGSFFGSIDEVSIYNRALSIGEIQSIYNAGGSGKCAIPPAIAAQPQNTMAVVGESATFNVTATGTQPLSYQWSFNGTNLAGATTSSLPLMNVQFSQAGSYAVVVTNVLGSVTSSNAVLTVNPPPPCVTPPSGLVSWWRGQNNAMDQVSGNNGTNVGNATFGPGRVGQGFVFDGNGDGVDIGNPANLQLQNFTIETWIKRASPSRATQGPQLNGTMFSGPNGGYGLGLWDDGRLLLSKIGVSGVFSTTVITDTNTFHHVAVTKSGANVFFYVDGVAESVGPYDPGFVFNGPMAIGARGGDYGTSFFGSIDEVSVYNRALSASEIQSIYNAGGSGKCETNLAPFITAQPTNQTVLAGGVATFAVQAGGIQPLSYQWRKNGSDLSDGGNISGATGSALNLSPVSSGDAATYDVIVANAAGSITSAPAALTVLVPPAITSQPASRTNNAGTTATFSVSVTGTSPFGYQWRKNGNNLSDGGNVSGATGSELNLSAVSSGDAATYDVVVANVAGSITSAPAALTVVIPPTIITQPQSQTNNAGATVTFNVVASGNFLTYQWRKGTADLVDGGKISGAQTAALTLANVLFSDSGGYSVVVANSAGSATSDAAALTVDVDFTKAVYNGLFYDTNGVSHESSGFFTAKTTTKGTFSAKLQLAGKKYSSSGLFNADGKAVNSIARTGLSPLTIELSLDFSGKDQITGRVTDGIWSADLTADKALFDAVTNPAPQAGRYTMNIPGNPDSAESPGGDGFGTVMVNAGGKISLKGTLGDGTKVSQKTSLSKNGQWPFYVSSYKGSGSVLSWATFTNSGIKEFSGDMSWIKKANPLAKLYAAGFTNETTVAGSFYTPPLPGNRVLNFGVATILFTGGNLSQSFSNDVALGTDNKVTNLSSNGLSLTLALPTGLFKGKATDPASGGTISFKGAVSQKDNSGSGFFPGTNQSGRVYFGE